MKVIKLRNVPKQRAKAEILNYLKKRDVVYPSNMAEDLRLDYGLVVEIVHELLECKKVEVVEKPIRLSKNSTST